MADVDSTRPLVLASASPRRRHLLARLGLEPIVVPAEVDETAEPGESPDALARRLALAKAAAVADGLTGDAVVLAGDTVVALDGEELGKPSDRAEAERMLRRLAGRTHAVHSAVAVATSRGDLREATVATTEVTFREIGEAELEWYLATEEWQGKAGAYAVQGAAAVFVTDMHGLHTTVIGLPLAPTIQLLRAAGLDPLVASTGGRP